MALAAAKIPATSTGPTPESKDVVVAQVSNEVVFAIVGHVGSGNTEVAKALKEVLERRRSANGAFSVAIIKARAVIEEGMKKLGTPLSPGNGKLLVDVERYQNAGDRLREKDHAAIARGAIAHIRRERASMQGVIPEPDKPVVPDGRPRAFIIDSLRHPAEVGLLRHLYRDAFVLIGVVCEQEERRRRISKKYDDAGENNAERFMKRDAKAKERNGQRVADTFHLSDFFIDNTASRILDDGRTANPDWNVSQELERLTMLVTHAAVARPTSAETAMHAAAGAAMRSACLSRQVGAALVDVDGNVIATGTNEVPKAGGGVYGEGFDEGESDDRCAFGNRFCSNTQEQNKIADELLSEILGPDDARLKDKQQRQALLEKVRDGRVGDLLEFSRAVHAEMDALLSAGRKGVSTVGGRLFVTTFPCHYCARHIVSAGVDEVQFIEPYPKSQALTLHKDSIQFETGSRQWIPPSSEKWKEDSIDGKRTSPHVLFRPFTGVAPRMYSRAFQKDRELKDKTSGNLSIRQPDWGTPYDISSKSYAELEAALTKDVNA